MVLFIYSPDLWSATYRSISHHSTKRLIVALRLLIIESSKIHVYSFSTLQLATIFSDSPSSSMDSCSKKVMSPSKGAQTMLHSWEKNKGPLKPRQQSGWLTGLLSSSTSSWWVIPSHLEKICSSNRIIYTCTHFFGGQQNSQQTFETTWNHQPTWSFRWIFCPSLRCKLPAKPWHVLVIHLAHMP